MQKTVGQLLDAKGGEQHQRLTQVPGAEPFGRGQGHGEEALHVGGAEAVEAPVARLRAERVAGPAAGVVGDRVGVSGEDQPAWPVAECGDQVDLVGMIWNLLPLDAKAEWLGPLGEQLAYAAVAHVELWIDAADRGRGDQASDHLVGRGEA